MPDDMQEPEDSISPIAIPSERETRVFDLQAEMDLLTSQQNEARRRAAYGGMTPQEAREYDARRARISVLAERILQLRKAE